MQHSYLGVVGINVYPLFNYLIPVTPILFFAERVWFSGIVGMISG